MTRGKIRIGFGLVGCGFVVLTVVVSCFRTHPVDEHRAALERRVCEFTTAMMAPGGDSAAAYAEYTRARCPAPGTPDAPLLVLSPEFVEQYGPFSVSDVFVDRYSAQRAEVRYRVRSPKLEHFGESAPTWWVHEDGKWRFEEC